MKSFVAELKPRYCHLILYLFFLESPDFIYYSRTRESLITCTFYFSISYQNAPARDLE
jgi:hypothetical protein